MQSPQRIAFVDLLRGWAVVFMIETHVVNALLMPSLREQTSFSILKFMNGLVAPTFLFCAGFAFAITMQRKWNEYINVQKSFWLYIKRLLFILIVGYSLHVPVFTLNGMLSLKDEMKWQTFFQSDILHVISLTLLASVILIVFLRNQKTFTIVATLLALLIVFLAPIIRELDYSNSPPWFRSYLSINYESQFPLFPWSAFLLGGMLVGVWILKNFST
ncbi:MAG: DUF1624 domain-containing protein, partial [Ignavibacteriales bacterium]|nr:DUF1624 domain-containing protein [Ignavibacteriales bacterium]